MIATMYIIPIKKSRQETKKSISSSTFIDDLVLLNQIKQELQNPFLPNHFL